MMIWQKLIWHPWGTAISFQLWKNKTCIVLQTALNCIQELFFPVSYGWAHCSAYWSHLIFKMTSWARSFIEEVKTVYVKKWRVLSVCTFGILVNAITHCWFIQKYCTVMWATVVLSQQGCGQWRWWSWEPWAFPSAWNCCGGSCGASSRLQLWTRSSSSPQRWPAWSTSSPLLHPSEWLFVLNIMTLLWCTAKRCEMELCVQ